MFESVSGTSCASPSSASVRLTEFNKQRALTSYQATVPSETSLGARTNIQSSKGDSAHGVGSSPKKTDASLGPFAVFGLEAFKSSVHCDRAEISVSPKTLSLVKPLLHAAVQDWQMDTLTLAEFTGNQPLRVLAGYIFEQQGLIEHFAIDRLKLEKFLGVIERGYPEKNQYHNSAHAASVLHFMHAFLSRGGVADAAVAAAPGIEDADRRRSFIMLVGLLAAIVHDYEHEGLNNDFLVKTFSAKAICHNDVSPNESHHVAAAFAMLLRPDCNFLQEMALEEFRLLRKLVVELVLNTDMAKNADTLNAFRTANAATLDRNSAESANPPHHSSPDAAMLSLRVALKCADLGHLALGWNSHLQWVRRLEAEFFAQGDQEKHLSMPCVSFLMDRDKPGVSDSQVGFFDFVVLPLFQTFSNVFPSTSPVLVAVEENYQRWREIDVETQAMCR